ncbi:hypothetical protein [Leeuwenhoekiella marinoflava]|uniref:hypothetical protein n=1 Tax=Leeuwenhoekiella marinoflava TaxID=988 RepID=UPI0030026F6D
MVRNLVLLAFAVWVTGCKDIETKKVSSDTFLKEELKNLNMNEVEEYPSFASCDSIEGQDAVYECFKTELALNFQRQLSAKTIIVESELNDTIWLYLSISDLGDLKIEQTEIPDTIAKQLPQLESWLKDSLDSLPKIYPAHKRGIPVKTMFKMPIVIQVE